MFFRVQRVTAMLMKKEAITRYCDVSNHKKLIKDRRYSFVCILKNILFTLTGHCMGKGCRTCFVCVYLSVPKPQANMAYFTVSKTLLCVSSFGHFQHKHFRKNASKL